MNKLNNSDKYNQLKKEVTDRKFQLQIENNEEVRLAAVSILIENDNDNYPIYMIKRADEGVHALEWAFPGGKYEEEDTDLLDTAKRETHEEIGIPNDFISFWGPLDPVYTLGTGWKIFPFIGVVKSDIETIKNEEEVQEITKIPLFKLLESKNNRYVSFTTNNGRIDSKSYVYENKLIWGASARIISQINSFI
ncbi:MAG: coenzyme A pyrophosphatase [Chloroflexi bacterium]|nr:coenzyme A pyrophosphatase [Chloroflexota bacterium]